jgi:hypothetical protein
VTLAAASKKPVGLLLHIADPLLAIVDAAARGSGDGLITVVGIDTHGRVAFLVADLAAGVLHVGALTADCSLDLVDRTGIEPAKGV